jgi:hypothetical protein
VTKIDGRLPRQDAPGLPPSGHPDARSRHLPSARERAAVDTTNGVSPTVIAMAACQRAWARRYAPWTLREDA